MSEDLRRRLQKHIDELEENPSSSQEMIDALREALEIAEPISETRVATYGVNVVESLLDEV